MRDHIDCRINGKEVRVTWLDLLAFLYFSRISLINFLLFLHIPSFLTAGVVVVSVSALFVMYTVKHFREIKWDGVLMISLAAAFFILTLKLHPEYQRRFLDVYNGGRFSAKAVFSLCAPIYAYYIVRMYEKDIERFNTLFDIMPYVIGFGNFVLIFNRNSVYRMDFGYHMSMAAILFMGQYLYQKKKSSLFFSLFFMSAGVLFGSRACIVGFAVFIIVFMLWDHKFSVQKALIVTFGATAVFIVKSKSAMMEIYYFFSARGFQSRTLYKLATGDVASDNARQKHLWPILIRLLEKSSFTKMYGAFGDRYYLPDYYPYAHNIILEILLTFGKLLGGCFLVLIAFGVIWVFFRKKNKAGILTLAFACFSLPRLMVSTSFWVEPFFWSFIAMAVNLMVNERKRTQPIQRLKEILSKGRLYIRL